MSTYQCGAPATDSVASAVLKLLEPNCGIILLLLRLLPQKYVGRRGCALLRFRQMPFRTLTAIGFVMCVNPLTEDVERISAALRPLNQERLSQRGLA